MAAAAAAAQANPQASHRLVHGSGDRFVCANVRFLSACAIQSTSFPFHSPAPPPVRCAPAHKLTSFFHTLSLVLLQIKVAVSRLIRRNALSRQPSEYLLSQRASLLEGSQSGDLYLLVFALSLRMLNRRMLSQRKTIDEDLQ